ASTRAIASRYFRRLAERRPPRSRASSSSRFANSGHVRFSAASSSRLRLMRRSTRLLTVGFHLSQKRIELLEREARPRNVSRQRIEKFALEFRALRVAPGRLGFLPLDREIFRGLAEIGSGGAGVHGQMGKTRTARGRAAPHRKNKPAVKSGNDGLQHKREEGGAATRRSPKALRAKHAPAFFRGGAALDCG